MHAIYDAQQGAARLMCNIVAFSKFRQLMGYAFQAVRGITGKTARRIDDISAIADTDDDWHSQCERPVRTTTQHRHENADDT